MIQSLFTIESLISLAIFKLNLTILEKITVRTWYFKQILFHSNRFKETFFSIDQYVNISVEQKSKSDLYGRIKFRYFPFLIEIFTYFIVLLMNMKAMQFIWNFIYSCYFPTVHLLIINKRFFGIYICFYVIETPLLYILLYRAGERNPNLLKN